METASDIQWMREEKIDGEEQEAASEEESCEGEGKSQSKDRSEEGRQETGYKESCQEDCQEGSQETGCKESCQENYQEDCQEARCSYTQGGSEEAGGDDGSTSFVQTIGTSSRQEIREAVRG